MCFSNLQFPLTLTPEEKAEKEALDEDKTPRPEGANVELIEEFMGQLNAKREQWRDHERHFCKSFFMR